MTQKGETSFKKTWNILQPFLIYFVVHDLAQVGLAVLMNLSMGAFGGEYAAYMTAHAQTVNGLLNALSLLIGMASVGPMAYRELRFAKEESGPSRITAAGGYLLLSFFAVSLAMGTNIWMTLSGISQSSPVYSGIEARQYGVAFGAGVLIYGILSPLAEEIVFRGLIFNRMKRYFPSGMSVAVCGLLFGAYHGNLVQGIYGTVLGIAITYSYEKYKSFAAPLLFHSLANLSVFTAGYSRRRIGDIATVPNGVIFTIIAAVSLLLIIKYKQLNK